MRYNQCLKTDLIQDNDNILKAQQRLYIMQNNLIKYFPSEEQFQQIVQESNQEDQKISEAMHEKCHEAKIHLALSLAANEKQQFKKIKKNLGQSKWAITTLAFYIYVNTYSTIFLISFALVLAIHGDKDPDSNSPFDINQSYIVGIGYTLLIVNLLQLTAFPFFLDYLLDKKSLFGQDYGEWQEEEEKK